MARRARRDNSIELMLRSAGMAFLLILLLPGGRQFLSGIGVLVALLALLGIAGLIIYRLLRRRNREETKFEMEPISLEINRVEVPRGKPVATNQLADRLRAIDWFQFEQIIAIACRKSGFTVTRKGGANPDGGIDIIVSDASGNRTAIQSKQWKTWNVGVKVIREFLGALTDAEIQKGIIVTLGGYTGEAKRLADKHGIQLLNETDLIQLLERVHARFDPEILALLNDKRKLCPKCEHEMILRTARKGSNAGSQFWGCSTYPRCHFKMPVA
jgi:HJR/Mrr/RecB family endonuclease